MGCQNAGGQGLTRGRISKKRVIKINLSDVPLFVKNLFCCSFRAKLLVCNFRAKFILLVVQFPCKIYFACCAISVQNLFCLLCNFRAKFILRRPRLIMSFFLGNECALDKGLFSLLMG